MYYSGITFIVGLLLCGCAAQLNSRQTSSYRSDVSIDELRLELADVQHALKATQVELSLLDERVKKEANTLTSTTKQTAHSTIAQLEARVAHLEKLLEKATADLRNLSTHTTQALSQLHNLEHQVSSHEKRLDEVVKLKGTLTSISNAIGQGPTSLSSTTSYRVKAGDSLEKIARKYKVGVGELKAINNLNNDRIVVGQELKVPDAN